MPEDLHSSADIQGTHFEEVDLISLVIENKLLAESISPVLDSDQICAVEGNTSLRDLDANELTSSTLTDRDGESSQSDQAPVELVDEDQNNHVENAEPQVVEEPPANAIVLQPALVNNIFANGIGPLGFKPYKQPTYFAMRIACLVALICFTLFFMSLLSITVPGWYHDDNDDDVAISAYFSFPQYP